MRSTELSALLLQFVLELCYHLVQLLHLFVLLLDLVPQLPLLSLLPARPTGCLGTCAALPLLGSLLKHEPLLLIQRACCLELLLQLDQLSLSVLRLLLSLEHVLRPAALGRLAPLLARKVPQPDQLLVFLADHGGKLRVVRSQLAYHVVLLLEPLLYRLQLLRVRECVLALDDLLKLEPEPLALLGVGGKLNLHLLEPSPLHVASEHLDLLGLAGDYDLHLFQTPLQVQRQVLPLLARAQPADHLVLLEALLLEDLHACPQTHVLLGQLIGCQLLLQVLFVEGLALEVDDARPQTGGLLVVLGAIRRDRPLIQLLDVGQEHWLLLRRWLHQWVVPW